MKESFVNLLNSIIYHDKCNQEMLLQSINKAKDVLNFELKYIDLIEEYTEESLKFAKKEIVEGVKAQNFEWASKWRDRSNRLNKYLLLKNEHDINTSQFMFSNGELIFFNCKTNNQDAMVEDLLLNVIKVT